MRRKEGDKGNGILNAAIRVFARDGFDKAQVSAIAREAGVGTGSIYLYFAGKDDILCGLFARFWDNLASAMDSLPANDPLFRMNDQLGLFFDALVVHPDLAHVYLREHHRFLDGTDAEALAGYRTCLALGRSAFAEIAKASDKPELAPEALELSQSFLFGGMRAALETALDTGTDPSRAKRHMQTMAMASLLSAIEGERP